MRTSSGPSGHGPARLRALAGAAGVALAVAGCGVSGAHGTGSLSAAPSMAAEESAIRSAEDSLATTEEDETGGSANVAGGLGDAAADAAVSAAAGGAGTATTTTALAALAAIPVRGRAPLTGYSRDQFGHGWADTDHNGCDTRNDVLGRDLTGETFKPGTRSCVVLSGDLADPYSGRAIAFRRGATTSEAVQIDHVVALADAWQKGAQSWDGARRTAFANDRLNLLAVDGPLNEQKGAGDAATWLPPNTGFRCAYVARQVAVKVTYGLWMTQAEKNAIATVLTGCPGQALPDGVTAGLPQQARPAPLPAVPPAPVPADTPAPVPAPAPGGSVYYANCDAARAAGAAPIYRGQPGYRDALDRDHDGIACE